MCFLEEKLLPDYWPIFSNYCVSAVILLQRILTFLSSWNPWYSICRSVVKWKRYVFLWCSWHCWFHSQKNVLISPSLSCCTLTCFLNQLMFLRFPGSYSLFVTKLVLGVINCLVSQTCSYSLGINWRWRTFLWNVLFCWKLGSYFFFSFNYIHYYYWITLQLFPRYLLININFSGESSE